MVEKSKNSKTASISEADVSTVLERYSATTVLALLQEVAQVSDVKIDWNALMKNTTTGISSAREYQMLWRHLAYRHDLLHKLEIGAEPLDDDSDLECDLEASPTPSCETSAEAAACVKVLITSGLPSDSSVQNGSTIEAPLMINIPNARLNRNVSENSQTGCSIQGTNITIPVVVQKQPLTSVPPAAELLETNGSASSSLPNRKKRKKWSEDEDMELIAAVEKFGEGNWANILKGEFKSDRTASQLSQRWATIRRRHGNLNQGTNPQTPKPPNSDGSKISEAMLAARRAMSLALDTPKPNLTAGRTNTKISSKQLIRGSTLQPEPQPVSTPPDSRALALGLKSQPRVAAKKAPPKSYSPDSMVKAAAVAAGARIATQNDAVSLIKSANAVHIMGSGGSLIKSSLPGVSTAHTNMKHARPALPVVPAGVSCTNGNHLHGHSTEVVVPSSATSSPNRSPEQTNAPASVLIIESSSTKEVETSNTPASVPIIESSSTKEVEASNSPASDPIIESSSTKEVEASNTPASDLITQSSSTKEINASTSTDITEEQVQESHPPGSSNAPNEHLLEDQTAATNTEAPPHSSPMVVDERLNCSSGMEIDGGSNEVATASQNAGNHDVNGSTMMELPAKEPGESQCEEKQEFPAKEPGESQCEMKEDSKNPNQNGKEIDLLNTAMEDGPEKVEAMNKEGTLNDTVSIGENERE